MAAGVAGHLGSAVSQDVARTPGPSACRLDKLVTRFPHNSRVAQQLTVHFACKIKHTLSYQFPHIRSKSLELGLNNYSSSLSSPLLPPISFSCTPTAVAIVITEMMAQK